MAKYLDKDGVTYLWSKIKDNFWAKSDIDTTFIEVVSTLPTTNIKRCLYIVKDSTTTQNNYPEYIYTGDLPISDTHPYDSSKWEKLGDFEAEIDLADYLKGVSTNQNNLVFTKGDGSTTTITVPYAKSAGKVNNPLNIILPVDGASTYDGSSTISIKITPASIGAASLTELYSAISYTTIKLESNTDGLYLRYGRVGATSTDKSLKIPLATASALGVAKLYNVSQLNNDSTTWATDGTYDVKTINSIINSNNYKNFITNSSSSYNRATSTTNTNTFLNQVKDKSVLTSLKIEGSDTISVSTANTADTTQILTISGTKFTGAVSGSGTTKDGTAGYVPAPTKANEDDYKYLRGDGTWSTPAVTIWGNSATDTKGSGSLADTAYLNTVVDKGESGKVINSVSVTAGTNISIIGLSSGGITIGTTATADTALTTAEIDEAIA